MPEMPGQARPRRGLIFCGVVDFGAGRSTGGRTNGDFMQYMLMIFENKEAWATLSNAEKNRIHEECGAWHGELERNGNTRTAMALEPFTTATTVRASNGQSLITDGPFAETKEVLGGYEILECRDLDEALAIAKRFPALRVGAAIEIRPVRTAACVEPE
jgi:hypothetical protein